MSQDKWNAADYNQQSSAQTKWAQELVSKLDLQGHERLLDIGCGTGRITSSFAQQLPNGTVVGIDSSAEMIDFAQKEYQQQNLHFFHMDASAINLDYTFDIAFSNAVLHWIKDHESVLRGVRQHMKPDGKILFQMGGQGNALDVIDAVNEIIKQPSWSDYFTDFEFPYYFCETEVYEQWLPQTGFKGERIELISRDMQHDLDGFKGWLRTTWFPFTNRIPAEKSELFIEQIVEAYIAQHPADDNGIIHIAMVRLEVEAVAYT
jgi:trans-aconitate 2-methyltransferase